MTEELDRSLDKFMAKAALEDECDALKDVLGDLLRECTNADGDVFAPSVLVVESAMEVMRQYCPGDGW